MSDLDTESGICDLLTKCAGVEELAVSPATQRIATRMLRKTVKHAVYDAYDEHLQRKAEMAEHVKAIADRELPNRITKATLSYETIEERKALEAARKAYKEGFVSSISNVSEKEGNA